MKSVREVADELAVSTKVVRAEIERGALSAHRIGRKGVYRVPDEAVAEYKERTLVVPTPVKTRPSRSSSSRSSEVRHLRALQSKAHDA
jgi:excisionase family DNA binding protein